MDKDVELRWAEAYELLREAEYEASRKEHSDGNELARKITATAYGLPAHYSGKPGMVIVDGWKLLTLLEGADLP